jgi:hypothetical protein
MSGFAFVLVGLTVLVVRRVGGNVAVDALTQPQGEPAGRRAWLIGSEVLSQIGWATILYGAIIVAGSIFAGPTAAATSVRGRVAPVLNERPGIAWATVGAVFLLLILWGRHARAPHVVGHRPARRADRHRRRRAAPPDQARVPRREGRRRRREVAPA